MSIAKKQAAKKAMELVKPGMIVGLGTGTTAYWAIQALGKKVAEGLSIKAVASSVASEKEAKKAGIEIISFAGFTSIDIYIDGADEVDEQQNLIKGGGGALLREKILAFNSKEFIVVVDETKLVQRLGKFHLPVEIIPFASQLTIKNIAKLSCNTVLRIRDDEPFVTDNENWIVDCDFGTITSVEELNIQLHLIPGVVETGLFSHAKVSKVIAGSEDGSVRLL